MAEQLIISQLPIKQIRVGDTLHEIDAKYFGGYTYDEIVSLVQGVIGTYVIPISNASKEGYDSVVKSESTTVTTTKSILNGLTNADTVYKLGDIVLMEEVSDGSKVFDRWVSEVSGDTIKLTVLETQVAKHHHEIKTETGSAITHVSTTNTTVTIPTVGESITVLDGSSAPTVVTSVSHDDKGKHNLTLSSTSGSGSLGHSHTVSSHSHSVNIVPSDFVDETVDVYTSLSTSSYTPHTHSTTTVAAVQVDGDDLVYATGEGSTDTFVKTLKDSQSTTGSESLTTEGNAVGLTTNAQASTDAVGDVVKTTSAGGHSHTISVETDSDIVTSASVADTVITDVSFTYVAPTVQETVVTSVSTNTASVVTSVSASVSESEFSTNWQVTESGILELTFASALTGASVSSSTTDVISTVSQTTASQSAGSTTLSTTSASQSIGTGKVSLSGTTSTDGGHAHGFSHTHTIASHTHTIASHSHSYTKSVADATGSAYTSLTTGTYVPHTHESATVVSNTTNGDAFTYLASGTTISVVKTLKSDVQTLTTTSDGASTDTKYVKLTGDITFPGLTVGTKTLSTTTVNPAVEGTEYAIASITTESGSFVTSIDSKTSGNIGGEVNIQ